MPNKPKQLKVKTSKGPKIHDAKGVQASFAYVLKMVEDKWTICEAVELANVDRSAFYKFITPKQKEELHAAKTAHTLIGSSYKMHAPLKKENGQKKAYDDDGELPDFFPEIFNEPRPDIDWDF